MELRSLWAGGVAQKQACIYVEVLGFSSEQPGEKQGGGEERKEIWSWLFEKRKQDSKLVLMTQNYKWERRHCS